MRKRLFVVAGVLLAVVSLSALSGCQRYISSECMSFDNVSYVSDFPESFRLENGKKLELGLIGVQSLSVQDSILIVSTLDPDGFWSFFRLPDYSPLGSYLSKGRSRAEFIASPRVGNQYFMKNEAGLCSLIYDFYTGDLSCMDISKTLSEKIPVINKMDSSLDRTLFNVVCMDSTVFFCRAVNGQHTELSRYIFHNGEKAVSENIKILNEAMVAAGSDINILGTYCRYNPKRRIIVEAAMDLSVINLYSADNGQIRMSICPERRLDRIKDIQTVERRKKKVAYCHLAAYDDFFAALYYGDTVENIHYERARDQRMQIFDWDGNSLAEVEFDRPVNSFDIDFSSGILYTLNYDKDEIYSYDIRPVLEYLQRKS